MAPASKEVYRTSAGGGYVLGASLLVILVIGAFQVINHSFGSIDPGDRNDWVYIPLVVAMLLSTMIWGSRVIVDEHGVEIRWVLRRRRFEWTSIDHFEVMDTWPTPPFSNLWSAYRFLGVVPTNGAMVRTPIAFRISNVLRLEDIVNDLNTRRSEASDQAKVK